MFRAGIVCLVDDDIDKRAAGEFLVQARGREVHVAGNVITLGDQQLAQDVLRAASLVSRYRVLVRVVLLDRVSQVVEVGAAGICFVTTHQPGPLAVAHRAHARVGQQIDIHVFRLQQKRVVASFAYCRITLLLSRHLQELDHFDFVRLGPGMLSHGYTSSAG